MSTNLLERCPTCGQLVAKSEIVVPVGEKPKRILSDEEQQCGNCKYFCHANKKAPAICTHGLSVCYVTRPTNRCGLWEME